VETIARPFAACSPVVSISRSGIQDTLMDHRLGKLL
jgi:hypothetical protein